MRRIRSFSVEDRAASTTGAWSACSNSVVVGPNNTTWPSALEVGENSTTTGYLQSQGEARWFKIPILPNSRVEVNLSNLPADYDLVMFSDIQAAYDALSAGTTTASGGPGLAQNDLTNRPPPVPNDAFNTSQYDTSSWDPLNWNPALNTTASFSASQWSASQWSASQWSASQWSASQWSASQWSASQWSASQWSASQWSASQWSASQWSASQWSGAFEGDPQLFSSAQTASLLAISAQDSTTPEFAGINTWNNTGYIYLRVQGKNGVYDASHPFTVTTKQIGNLCAGVSAPAPPLAPPTATPGVAPGTNTLILTDSTRINLSAPLGATTLGAKLNAFAGLSSVNGIVVDVNADGIVRGLKTQADAHPGCPYAKNLVANRIGQIVAADRAAATSAAPSAKSTIKYVVVVGNDDVIPFFRYPDHRRTRPASRLRRRPSPTPRHRRRACGSQLSSSTRTATARPTPSLHGNSLPGARPCRRTSRRDTSAEITACSTRTWTRPWPGASCRRRRRRS